MTIHKGVMREELMELSPEDLYRDTDLPHT